MTSIYLGYCIHCQEDVVFKEDMDESKKFKCSTCNVAIESPLAPKVTSKNHFHIAS